jgi:hypothetical protein
MGAGGRKNLPALLGGPTMYSNVVDVKSVTFARRLVEAEWDDEDVRERIEEGDNVINAKLKAMGYDVPFATTPPLVKTMSILYARWAISRDVFHEVAPSRSSGDGYKSYLDRFERIFDLLSKGEMVLLDAEGNIINSGIGRVQINTEDVARAMTMGDPSSNNIDPAYYDPDVIGGS